jgi:hypothetical protein
MRTSHISLETFSAVLRQRRPFLRHIPLITVEVVDHLNVKIPVPIMFCSEWKVGGRCLVYISESHTSARILTISSMAIATIVSEIALLREAIIKIYEGKMARRLVLHNFPM